MDVFGTSHFVLMIFSMLWYPMVFIISSCLCRSNKVAVAILQAAEVSESYSTTF